MKCKAGDMVRIESTDWYHENKNPKANCAMCGNLRFTDERVCYCGTVMTIASVNKKLAYDHYRMVEDGGKFVWNDDMIVGLAERGFIIKAEDIKEGHIVLKKDIEWKHEFECPDGYEFRDENGNVINTAKIVLEKKKKEYPKTYEECCKVLGIPQMSMVVTYYREKEDYEVSLSRKLRSMQKLLICRDAYWKLYGEEMGLRKPWEPDWGNPDHDSYPTITRCGGKIIRTTIYTHDCPLSFPTPEMRDAFKENFDPEIEICKEFL